MGQRSLRVGAIARLLEALRHRSECLEDQNDRPLKPLKPGKATAEFQKSSAAPAILGNRQYT